MIEIDDAELAQIIQANTPARINMRDGKYRARRNSMAATQGSIGFGLQTSQVQGSAILTGALQATQSSFVTASWTPVANRFYVVSCVNVVGSGSPNVVSMTGNSISWFKAKTIVSGFHRLTVFVGTSPTPVAGSLTFTFLGQSQVTAGWTISEFTGVLITNTDATRADALANVITSSQGSSSSATVAVPILQILNGQYSVCHTISSQISGPTAKQGQTQLNSEVVGANGGLMDAWNPFPQASIGATFSLSSASLWIVIELAAVLTPS